MEEIIFKNFFKDKYYLYILKRGGDKGLDKYSFRRVNELALKLAIYINQNLSNEKQILISMEVGVHAIVTILACIYANKTFIPVPLPKTKMDIDRINSILNECKISVAFVSNKAEPLFKSNNLNDKFSDIFNFSFDEIDLWEININNIKEVFYKLQESIPSEDKKSLVLIQYTSGSTNKPKGVKISSLNILANHELVAKAWNLDSSKRLLSWLPIHHDMGLLGIIQGMFLSGMQTYIMSPEDFVKKPIRWLKAISDYNIYVSGGPPFGYKMCIKSLEQHDDIKLDLSHWKVAFCGADYVPSKLMTEFRKIGEKHLFNKYSLFATYGMAEYTLFIMGEPLWKEKDIQSKVSYKTLSEGCYFSEKIPSKFLIYDNTFKSISEEGKSGEILISGKSTTSGYLSQTIDSVQIKNKTWIKTGDIGFIENSSLFITGRTKDLIKIYGRSLFVDDIVASLSKEYKELNAYSSHIFKKDDFSNSLTVVLELNSKLAHFTNDFLNSLKESITILISQEFGVSAEEVLLLNRGSLPKTTSGKVQRAKVKELYNKGYLSNEKN